MICIYKLVNCFFFFFILLFNKLLLPLNIVCHFLIFLLYFLNQLQGLFKFPFLSYQCRLLMTYFVLILYWGIDRRLFRGRNFFWKNNRWWLKYWSHKNWRRTDFHRLRFTKLVYTGLKLVCWLLFGNLNGWVIKNLFRKLVSNFS